LRGEAGESGEVTAHGPPRTVLSYNLCALQRNDTSAHVANLAGLEINLFSSSNIVKKKKEKKSQRHNPA